MHSLNYSLTRQTKDPTRGNHNDAGLDIYVPEFTDDFITSMDQFNSTRQFLFDNQIQNNETKFVLKIAPHGRIKIPTGVFFNVPEGTALMVMQKTSVPNKTGLISGARVIDQGYQGQFIASIINTSNKYAILKSGQKFIQLVLMPVYYPIHKKVDFKDLYETESTRGAGAYGSTGAN